MGFITANREQNIIFGFSLDEFVEKDSKCRYILKVIDKLDLRELYSRYSLQGAEAYEPKIILATWFLAYCEGVTSTRKLERACRKDLDFIYISGNLRPDHTTLSRFMQRNMDLWGKYFLQILELARQLKLSDFKEIAIDGTKIKAKSSRKKTMKQAKLERYINAINEDIRKYKEELEKEDSIEKKEKLEEQIEQEEKKRNHLQSVKAELLERKEKIGEKDRLKHQINIEEPEAPLMKLPQGNGYAPSYNGQIAVDCQSRLISSQELVQERNDEKQFSRQHSKIEENLGEDKERKYIADGGYNSLSQTEYVKENQIDAFISDPKLKNYRKDSIEVIMQSGKQLNKLDFIFDKENDCYICPMGESLLAARGDKNNKYKGRKYRTKNCNQCPINKQCLGNKNKSNRRTIFRDYREESAELMRQKVMSAEGGKMMLLRQSTVETVFGYIKDNLGYRRFRRKGLENAKGEFALFCLVYNLNRLYKLVLSPLFIKIRNNLIISIIWPVFKILNHGRDKNEAYKWFNQVRAYHRKISPDHFQNPGYATAWKAGIS
jgi:transposase